VLGYKVNVLCPGNLAEFSYFLQRAEVFNVKESGASVKGKGKAFPLQALGRPLGFQEVEAPRISRQSAHEGDKVVALRTGRLYHPGRIPGTHFC
jgi:hypothetical protein